MSTTNTVQHYAAVGLHTLADVVSAILSELPLEAQSKSNIGIGLQAVHEVAAEGAAVAAALPQTGLTLDHVLPELIKAFAPHIPGLVTQAVEAHFAPQAQKAS